MTVLFAAVLALALAVWGCGGSNPSYPMSEGGPQRDADTGDAGDAGRDAARHDGGTTDGAVPDGSPDGRLVDWDAFNPGPTIVFLTPAAGASVKPSISFRFSADDTDGLKAQAPEVLIDGNLVALSLEAPTDGEASHTWTAAWDIPAPPAAGALAEGLHTIAAKAWDTGDREGVGGINFTVDRSGPIITPISPLAGVLVGGTVRFQVQIDDAAGIDHTAVTLEIMQAAGSGGALIIKLLRVDPLGSDTSGTFYYDYDTSLLPTSLIRPQLLWRAYDRLGNESHAGYEVAVDNTPPSISLMGNPNDLSPPQDVYPAKEVTCWAVCGEYGCEDDLDEDATKCPVDCGPARRCGDTVCQVQENGTSCAVDCAPKCGDGTCDTAAGETADTCPADCHDCGDGVCHYPVETCGNCAEDCGACRMPCRPDGTLVMCAQPIDPLMNYMPDPDHSGAYVHVKPEATVPQAMYLRARVQDNANWVTGATVLPIATIDETKVRLYILPRDDRPLVVADAAGGTCLGTNPALKEVGAIDLLSDPDNVLVLDMTPVPPGGEADFRPYVRTGETPAGCDATGDAALLPTALPERLCNKLPRAVQSTFAIHPSGLESLAVIYSLPVVEQGDPYFCEGTQYDAYQLPDGWFCAAVVAEDKVGNTSVSRPLHLCLDKSWSGGGTCPVAPSTRTCVAVATDPALSPTAQCEIARPFGTHQVLISELLK